VRNFCSSASSASKASPKVDKCHPKFGWQPVCVPVKKIIFLIDVSSLVKLLKSRMKVFLANHDKSQAENTFNVGVTNYNSTNPIGHVRRIPNAKGYFASTHM
jgi:hypothetical protein